MAKRPTTSKTKAESKRSASKEPADGHPAIVSPEAERAPVPLDDGKPGIHKRFPTVSMSDPAVNREFAIAAARMLADDKCTDVVVLDVQGLSQVADYLVVGSGTSDRQMKSAVDDVAKLAATMNCPSFRRNADDRTTWVLLDCVDVVVHVFEPNTRSHYDLEMLWGDAARVEWERPSASTGRASRDRAGLRG